MSQATGKSRPSSGPSAGRRALPAVHEVLDHARLGALAGRVDPAHLSEAVRHRIEAHRAAIADDGARRGN